MSINPLPPPPNSMPIGYNELKIKARDLPNVPPRARLMRPGGMMRDKPVVDAPLLVDAFQRDSGAWVAVVREDGCPVEYEYEPDDELSISYLIYNEQ